jgi:dihydrofolate reductase
VTQYTVHHHANMQKTLGPRISIIASIGRNRELGKNAELVWRISDDLKRVKTLTMGHPLVMGRKTFESIGRPLPGRTNIVITQSQICIEGCLVFDTFEKALEAACAIDQEEVFIFGGAQVYTKALPQADRLYLTIVDATDSDADVFFPVYDAFTKIITEEKCADEKSGFSYTYTILER